MLSFLVRWKNMNHVMGQKCFYPFIRQFWTLYRRFVGMKEPHKRICSHIHPVAILTPRAQTHTWFQTHTSISYWLQETQPPAPLVFHSGQFPKSWFLDGHETIQVAKISKKSFIWFDLFFYICSKVFFSFRDPVDPFPSLDVSNFLHICFQPNTIDVRSQLVTHRGLIQVKVI